MQQCGAVVGPGARVRFLGNLAEVDVHFLLLFFNGQEMNRSGIKKGQRGWGFPRGSLAGFGAMIRTGRMERRIL